jgi:hypothetical protein
MRIQRFKVTKRSNPARRHIGRLALIGLLSTASVLLVQSSAFASGGDGLSSTILARTVPGLVLVPPGTENGPVTHSNVGAVGAFIRTWDHEPTDGDAVVIEAFEFKSSAGETFFLHTLDSGLKGQADEKGNAAFAVTGIPGASGVEVHTTSSGTRVPEYIVSFGKGHTIFQVIVATASRDLTAADAVSVANQQFAKAPDVPTSGTNWIVLPGAPLVVLLLCLATFAIRRKRRHPAALGSFSAQSGTNWNPPDVPPSGIEGFERPLAAPATESIGTSTVPVEVGALIPGDSNPG